jgi:hypothetical protein
MSVRKAFGGTVAAALLGALAGMGNGCSGGGDSGAGPGPSDAAAEMTVIKHLDAAMIEAAPPEEASAEAGAPGTTGKPCAGDMDCNGNACSSDYAAKVTGVTVQLWPTPLCIVPIPVGSATIANCDPAPPTDPTGNLIHFCDGPDDPSAPGICLPNTTPATAMDGLCLPKCTFGLDGSKASGCPGTDACVPYTFELDSMTNVVSGFGFCQGLCIKDADCSALGTSYKCQTDIGFCTMTTVTRGVADSGGAVGSSCTKATGDTGLCNCEYNITTNNGYCTQACLVGDTTNPCPAGYVCDDGFGGDVNFGDAGDFKLLKQTLGSAGLCLATCSVPDAGVGADGGAQCPPFGNCSSSTLVGPDCIP